MDDWYICMEDHGSSRKVAKIAHTRDGGFSLIVPHPKVEDGMCVRFPFDPTAYGDSQFSGFTPLELADVYRVSSRVKFTYHADGFVQLSGENSKLIRSGKYLDGTPKGLGIHVAPLHNPIRTGPSVGVVFWGLEEFPADNPRKKANRLEIREADYLYRRCTPSTWTGYLLEVLVFLRRELPPVYQDTNNRSRVLVPFPDFEGGPAVFQFYVVPIGHADACLGILVSRLTAGFNSRADFKFS